MSPSNQSWGPPPNKRTFLQVLLLLSLVAFSASLTSIKDKVISDRRRWSLDDSPFLVTDDLLVDPSGALEIEAGVEVRFAPEVGITVRGELKARGTETRKIRFLPDRPVAESQPNRTIRLVDGPSVHEGIVQLLDQGHWRSVCTNSRNWTAADMGVACRQLGFRGGEWYHWYPHLNDTRQILFQDPGKIAFLLSG